LALGLSGVKLLVEIDSGHHRSGCEPQQAGEIAHAAKKLGLNPVGVFTFPGHSYKPSGAKAAVADEQRALLTAVKSFRKLGIEPTVVSSGSTPSAQVTAKSSSKNSVITELRPGVYALNDAQQLELGSCNAKQIGLWAVATVVSANGNRLILDSGSKTLGADRPTWATSYGRLLDFPDARIEALSEHHATVVFPRPKKSTASGPTRVQRFPKIGDQLRVAPNHVCSAVNLVERLYLIDGKKVLGSWAVAARGRNS
ncbi:MAG: D-TA family PLP-dependent enzyme, partial [Actinobacteria bacterium]|nr:D-TA family PLP-dependent enzyme [Actinomycetota bacterium]